MLTILNETNIDIDVSLLEKIANSLSSKDVECMLVDDMYMKEINKEQRGIDKSTDVLSFPLDDVPLAPLGSIVINLELAKDISEKLNHPLQSEAELLFIHGMLHLLGFDHEIDDGKMREKEKELIGKFNLPLSLIDRTLE